MSGAVSAVSVAGATAAAAGASEFGIMGAAIAANLGAIGSIATIAGAGVSAAGAMKQGEAGKESAQYNAEVAANNATIASNNATWAGQAGDQQAAMQSQKTRATVGAINASQAASGVDVNSGSAVDVRSSAEELGQLDAITIRSNAARTAYGYENNSASETAQSQLDNFQAQNAESSGEISAGASLIGGVGSAASNYAKFQMSNSAIQPFQGIS